MIVILSALPLFAFPLSRTGNEQGFETLRLSEVFYGEGAALGDLDGDGVMDVVSGPFWYEGPDFERVHELEPPVESDPLAYSNDFFAWVHDVDGDGRNDVVKVGFPGQDAVWLRNPGDADGHWEQVLLFRGVDNESPWFVDLVGDGRPELVCNHRGAFGYATADPADPRAPWTFHAITGNLRKGRFTHGLGVGDLDGDGRLDVLHAEGWLRQPESLEGDPLWQAHAVSFSTRGGGAQMLAWDLDGDGDEDVVSSLAAHAFGLSWFENLGADGEGEVGFREHRVMDRAREASPFGVRFSALHALAAADMDGDGVLDLVTGKRHWSHGPDGDPEPRGPSVLYWFRTERTEGGARLVPHLIHGDSGVGTQVTTGDLDGDGRPDVLVGNKQGTFAFLQRPGGVDTAPPPLFQPPPAEPSRNSRSGRAPQGADGTALPLGFEAGDLSGWTATGDAFEGQPIRGDTSGPRCNAPSEHTGEYWIGGYELHGDARTGTLTSEPFRVDAPWASFLVGGGRHVGTSVELLDEEGRVLLRYPGESYESMKIALVDLSAWSGQLLRVRLVDRVEGGWGHVNFDDFLLHDTRPDLDPDLLTLPLDVVAHDGLEPEEAARAMTVPAGFGVDLVASEPDLHQPVALTTDHRGRLWVLEARTYPRRAPEGEGRDSIVVLEDLDADGHHESRTVFLEGLNLASGLAVGHGGVWIGAAPYLLFVPDADDDLVPDGEPEVVLDGWGYEDTHETLNSFTWGPDGWLYGCHGVFTHSRVGAPGTADEERAPIDAGVWRLHPESRRFEVFAWGTSNPWGIDFDERGQAFITACVIPHLYHVVPGGRYIRQAGDHFDAFAYEEIDTIADHRHYLGATPHGGNDRSSSAGGGHAHCGALIYRGEAFPEAWRGRVLMNNIHGNRVNSDRLERRGSGYVGSHGEDLVLANDRWYRGISLETGPDGAVYFIDWSDEQACHLTDPEVWDRTNGRLFRLRYGEVAPVTVDLRAADEASLAGLALDGDGWHARGARVELATRAVADSGLADRISPVLLEGLRQPAGGARRLRALWGLHVTGGLEEALLLEALADPDEDLAAWAVRLAAEPERPSAAVLAELRSLTARTTSAVVLLELAAALQRQGPDFEWLEALLVHEGGEDPNLPALLWYALEPHVAADPLLALRLVEHAPDRRLAGHAARRAAAREDSRALLVQAMLESGSPDWRTTLLLELDEALRDARGVEAPAGWAELYPTFAASEDAAVRDAALWVAAAFADPAALPRLEERLLDRAEEPGRRARALEALVASRRAEVASALLAVLAEPELRGAAIRGLAACVDERTPGRLLALYPELTAEERRDALATLTGRVPFAVELLRAVEAGEVPASDLSAFTLRKLRGLGDAEVDALVAAVWGVWREPEGDRAARVAELVERFSSEDPALVRPSNGRRVFEATCARCHELFGEGGSLGPELTGSNRADLEYLLTNLLDPNAVIGRDYQTTIVRTVDGLFVTGIAVAETETSLTLGTETDEVVVALADLEERYLSEVSAMPEGQLDALSAADQRDLIAYLRSPEQVDLPAGDLEEVVLFDGESLAGWTGDPAVWSVEAGELVGRTETGLVSNSFLVSDRELGDFRLELEVRLVGDLGNSGIQFRSRALPDGGVAGYQADIGPGWWGKLYEEHGRAVLSDRSGEGFIRTDGWNEYVIEARGSRIRTWINGSPCVDLDDPEGARSGRIAPQVHSGGPTEVRLRNLRLVATSSDG